MDLHMHPPGLPNMDLHIIYVVPMATHLILVVYLQQGLIG